MPLILLLVALGVTLLGVFLRWYLKAGTLARRRMWYITVLTVATIALVLLIATGRLYHALGLVIVITILLGMYVRKIKTTLSDSRNGDQGATATPQPKVSHQISVDEAAQVLGVSPNSTIEEINAAYRQKLKHVHPDAGGDVAEMQRLNAARTRLLEHYSNGQK